MNRLIIFLLCFFPLMMNAQLQENFADGDFTQNPIWVGNDAQFKVNTSFQLQLNSTGTDTSYLSTANQSILETEWRFWVKLSFNTSSNNLVRIYLTSSQSNIEGSTNGYFVEIGNTADNICLFRQDGNTEVKLINGTIASTNNTNNTLSIKVIHKTNGNWELFADANGGNNYLLEGSATDLNYTTSNWFGVYCKYTSSNATKFLFDDFYIGPIIVDTLAPKLISADIIDTNIIEVNFEEALDKLSAETISHYQISNYSGLIDSIRMDNLIKSRLFIYCKLGFTSGTSYLFSCNQIKDVAQNISSLQQLTIVYYLPKSYDIVFNEIMASPNPPVGLPSAEYIELKNTTNFAINLKNWKFQNGTSSRLLPSIIIAPQGFLLLCYQNDTDLLKSYGPYVAFSSFSLTNSGMQLILSDAKNRLIHQVNYSDTWYADNNKKNGGWSLEMIDPKNPCGCESNYKASKNLSGGTPNSQNSINTINPDSQFPFISRLIIVDSMHLKIMYSEMMDSSIIGKNETYTVNNSIGNPVSIQKSYPDYKSVVLGFGSAFQPHIIYTLEILDTIADCSGNTTFFPMTSSFGLAEMPELNDVVINEVLFNPKGDGVDFVELYNKSNKIVDLKNLKISNWNDILNEAENVYEITSEGYLLFPGNYVVLSTNMTKVKPYYYSGSESSFLNVAVMPSLNNDMGSCAIVNSSLQLIDRMSYTEEMHFALLPTVDGVSLEKIRFDMSGYSAQSWHSAAERYLYGTPGLKNSQFIENPGVSGEVVVLPEIFSPDNDGYNDVAMIQCIFNESGYKVNIAIYNSQGQKVKYLVKNELIGTEAAWTWQGTNEMDEKLPFGTYIIYIEVYNLKGNVQHYKKSIVLGGRL